jgi:hypothetical protein
MAGHGDIHEDQIRRQASHLFEGAITVQGTADNFDVILIAQKVFCGIEKLRVIVH